MTLLNHVQATDEYAAIAKFYGERRAERSQVLLINHIHEGVAVIEALEGELPGNVRFNTSDAARAYCLHPLFQNDAELKTEGMLYLNRGRPYAMEVMLAMEYRHRANDWLSDKVVMLDKYLKLVGAPDSGPLPEVRAMLIADKVQNYKDFLAHHKGKHARSRELDEYFKTWLNHLGIGPCQFKKLVAIAKQAVSA